MPLQPGGAAAPMSRALQPAGAPVRASIFASTLSGGIGRAGKLPWHLKEDMQAFEQITKTAGCPPGARNGIVMGRRTWESLPARPLRDRDNLVLSSAAAVGDCEVARGLEEGFRRLKGPVVFVGGGASVYDRCHKEGLVDYVVWTRVCGKANTTTAVDLKYVEQNYDYVAVSKTMATASHTFDFVLLKKKGLRTAAPEFEADVLQLIHAAGNAPLGARSTMFPRVSICKEYRGFDHEEYQYLDIMKDIIDNGVEFSDRTGIGTFAKFGSVMRYDISKSFPLLTTKKVYWKGVVEELLWFLKGETDANKLAAKNVHIWDDNGSEEFLRKRGLTYRQGDLGPVYGFQWRHFGAKYRDCEHDYSGEGIDQVKELVEGIKRDPASRRHILSAWNPSALRYMALPPCHILSQFVVDPATKEISCSLYQRSGDWGLGIPFNIASYSLLTYLIAHLTGTKPKEFVHFVGNAHVYKNHVDPLKEQLTRVPRPFPLVRISPKLKSIDDVTAKDVQLIGYEPMQTIKMEMAV